MMLLKRMFIAAAALAVFAGPAFADDPVLGKVDDYMIRQSDLDRVISYHSPDRQKYLRDHPEQKVDLVRRMLEVKMVSERARKEGIDKKPEVVEQLNFVINDFLAQEYILKVIARDVAVSSEDAKKFYTLNEKSFVLPEQVRVRHILVRVNPGASEDEKKKAREKAEGLLKRLKEGEDFEKMAREVSDDPGSKEGGGDLGFFGKGQVLKSFEEAAFSLKSGELSGIVETEYGLHIIKATDRKEAATKPFEEVKDLIEARLKQEKVRVRTDQFVQKLSKDAGLEVYADKVLEGK